MNSLSSRAFRLYFGRTSIIAAIVVLVVATVLPADGLGVELCMLKRMTDLPCPGCGMTRAVRAVCHGDPATAWRLNPFGLALLPWAVVTVSSLVWPRRYYAAVDAWFARHERLALRAGLLALAALILYGFVRLPLVAYDVWPRI